MNTCNGAGIPSPGGINKGDSHGSLCKNIPLEQFSLEVKTEANLLSRSFISNSEMATSEMHPSTVSSTCRFRLYSIPDWSQSTSRSSILSDVERREKNRLAQQKYRRNQRNELTLLRIRSTSLSRREKHIKEHITKLTQEKAVAEAKADVQSKLVSLVCMRITNEWSKIAKLKTRLNLVVCDFSKLHAQFEALKHIHCELLKQNATLRIVQIESESQSQDSLQTDGEYHSWNDYRPAEESTEHIWLITMVHVWMEWRHSLNNFHSSARRTISVKWMIANPLIFKCQDSTGFLFGVLSGEREWAKFSRD